MWSLPQSHICDYTVTCKGCGQNIPAPVQTIPDTWIIAEYHLRVDLHRGFVLDGTVLPRGR